MPRNPKRHQFTIEGTFIVEAVDHLEALAVIEAHLTGAGGAFDGEVKNGFIPTRTKRSGKQWAAVTLKDRKWVDDEFEADWEEAQKGPGS